MNRDIKSINHQHFIIYLILYPKFRFSEDKNIALLNYITADSSRNLLLFHNNSNFKNIKNTLHFNYNE